jgi:hypothetical protein
VNARTCLAAIMISLTSLALPMAELKPGAAMPEISAAAVADRGAFAVRAYHQHVFPERQPMAVFHHRLKQVAQLKYNMVVFGMGHPGAAAITMHKDGSITPLGCSTEDMRELVAHAVELGLEPVFEMKFVGKQIPLIEELLEEHPGLVIDPENRATVLNAAYRMPDGRDAYSATALPLVGYLLDLYPADRPAKYFHFGIDEFDADDMAVLAESLKMTPPEAFAHCLNLGTDYALKRGATPIIWGDILLGRALATPEHGITIPGFRIDPRHDGTPGRAYHADYKSGKISLHTMVNHLRDRDKIIVADWHYSPSAIGEFPSMDYFQSIGFKDVWGCPWYDPTNLRQFSRYAASRGCGGMMATAWHIAYRPTQRMRLNFILWSSSAYFRKPSLEPPPAAELGFTLAGSKGKSLANEKRAGLVFHDDLALSFRAPVPAELTPKDAVLLLIPAGDNGATVEQPLTLDPAKRELIASFTLNADAAKQPLYQLSYGYADAASGFFLHKSYANGFAVTDQAPVIPETAPDVYLQGDFREVGDPTGKIIWLGGQCAAPLGAARRKKPTGTPREGGLDTTWIDRVWVQPSAYLNEQICQGMEIQIEARMTGDFTGNDYCALFTKGSYHSGFRTLVRGDGHVLFQFAELDKGNPFWVLSKAPLPKDKWVTITLTYRPPVGEEPGEATIRFGDVQQAREPIPIAMRPSTAVIGIGCEFKPDPRQGPRGKLRPNFPGLIRAVTIKALSPR